MTYPQHLPNYLHGFEEFSWKTMEKGNYIFYYMSDGEAERDIEQIVDSQLKSFEKIKAFLAEEFVEPTRKIEYFFYPDAETKKQLMGDDWYAQSIYNEMRVHVLYTKEIKPIGPHEDTHLLTLHLGLAVGFVQEGLAEYMVGHDWYGNDLKTIAREGILKKIPLSPDFLYLHKAWIDTNDEYARYYYSIAAMFTNFFIEKYSKQNFIKLYKGLNREAVEQNISLYREITGSEPEEIFAEFVGYVTRGVAKP